MGCGRESSRATGLSVQSTFVRVLGVPTSAGTARPTAEAITAVVAERVIALRRTAGLNQEQLAERMAARGVPWKRSTVVNLEARAPDNRGKSAGRDAVTVQELFALALVLDVPPMMLLADPRHVDQVPVTQGTPDGDDLVVPAWEALLWLAGTGTIDKSDLDNYRNSAWLVQAGWGIVESVAELRKQERRHPDPEKAAKSRQRDDDRHRDALAVITTCIDRIRAAGAPLPPMPLDFLSQRADELDVTLPELDN